MADDMPKLSPAGMTNAHKAVVKWADKALLRGEVPAALLTLVSDGTIRLIQPVSDPFRIVAVVLEDGTRVDVSSIWEDESTDRGN